MRRISLLVLISLLLNLERSTAQIKTPVDKDPYYVTFEEQITTRLSIGKKYTSLIMKGPEGLQDIHYRPNSLTSLGLSGSYKSLSLGLGAAFDFLNPNKDARGKTHSFDLQSHYYTREWVTDIYGQFYRGYYLKGASSPGTMDRNYYIRPDLKVHMVGLSVYNLLNSDRFSYRAGFLQNEWQKRSAGSALVGAEIYYGSTKGDSALVPSSVKSLYPQGDVSRVRLFEIGPGVGYAYTAVYEENLFATGSITFNGDLSIVKETSSTGSQNRTTFSPNATLRLVAGYNSDEWAATISWVHNATDAKGRSSNLEYSVKTGQYSITLAKRFTPGSKFKRKMDPILQRVH